MGRSAETWEGSRAPEGLACGPGHSTGCHLTPARDVQNGGLRLTVRTCCPQNCLRRWRPPGTHTEVGPTEPEAMEGPGIRGVRRGRPRPFWFQAVSPVRLDGLGRKPSARADAVGGSAHRKQVGPMISTPHHQTRVPTPTPISLAPPDQEGHSKCLPRGNYQRIYAGGRATEPSEVLQETGGEKGAQCLG